MGRGKRQTTGKAGAPARTSPTAPASAAAATSQAPAFGERPPWPEESWHRPGQQVAELVLRGGNEVAAFADGAGVERSWTNAQERGVSAFVSGNDFDNAMGTGPFGSDGRWFQEHTVYLALGKSPTAELNLANLLAWASCEKRAEDYPTRKARAEALEAPRGLLTSAEALADFADTAGTRLDWHEPDEQELAVRVRGSRLDRSAEGLVVELCQADFDGERAMDVPGQALAWIFLADLLAWASGWERSQSAAPDGPRLRPSALA